MKGGEADTSDYDTVQTSTIQKKKLKLKKINYNDREELFKEIHEKQRYRKLLEQSPGGQKLLESRNPIHLKSIMQHQKYFNTLHGSTDYNGKSFKNLN